MQQIKTEREREREREREKTQSNYTGSFHKPEVVCPPCTSNESSLKSNIWLQMLTTKTSKRLQTTQGQLQEISYAPEHNQETSFLKHNCKRLLFKQNYKEKCLRFNTWHTISGVHNTNQIQTLKTLEFLRYELWKEILSELLMQKNFSRGLALSNCCWVSTIL